MTRGRPEYRGADGQAALSADPADNHRGLVAIPAFNEEQRLGAVLERIAMAELIEDVAVIDDGSRDRTAEIAASRGIRVIAHEVNRGYRAALRTALRTAVEEARPYLVLLDADGQHDPAEIAKLRDRWRALDRPEVIIGSRFAERTGYRSSFARRAGMIAFEWLTAAVGLHVHDTTSGFKILSARAVRVLAEAPFNDLHAELIVLAATLGWRVAEVPVHVAPQTGTSMYGLADSIRYPLRAAVACARLARWGRAHR